MQANKIIQGDCIEVMHNMETESIDTIITDPPYGLEFMGKKWDYDVPSIEVFKEMLRVIKPGGTLLCFAGTRTQHRMAVNIEDAGWILKDCIMWLYGSGFPKATDISKQLDKKEGKERDKMPNPKAKQQTESKGTIDYGDYEATTHITPNPVSEEAKLWNGWKSHGLKPAYEPILVAMKPNEGTYAQNALKHGVSGLNIDGGRIGFKDEVDEKESKGKNQHSKYPKSVMRNPAPHGIYHQDKRPPEDYKAKGRFPANILLDEEAAKMLDEQSGESKDGIANPRKTGKILFDQGTKGGQFHKGYGGSGGASRFFKVIK